MTIFVFLVLCASIGCGGDGSDGGAGSGGSSGAGGTAGQDGIGGGAGTAGGSGIGGSAGMGGGGTGGIAINATVDEGVVLDAAIDAFDAAGIAIGGDGEGGAVELADVGASAVNIVIPPESQSSATFSPKQGTCECTENSCTFTDCDNGVGLALTGTISWTENTLDCDYNVSGDQAGTNYSFNIFCDLDYTPTSLSGQLDTNGTVEVVGMTTVWISRMTFNDVTYADGQPTGGSMDVFASVMARGETYTAGSTVNF